VYYDGIIVGYNCAAYHYASNIMVLAPHVAAMTYLVASDEHGALLLLFTTISIYLSAENNKKIKTNRRNGSERRAAIVRLSHAVNGDAHAAAAIAQQPSPCINNKHYKRI